MKWNWTEARATETVLLGRTQDQASKNEVRAARKWLHAHESGLVPVAYVRATHEFVTRSGIKLTVKPDTENGEFTGSLFLIKGGLKNPVWFL